MPLSPLWPRTAFLDMENSSCARMLRCNAHTSVWAYTSRHAWDQTWISLIFPLCIVFLVCPVQHSVLCQSKTCIVAFLVRPRRLHRHANLCSSFSNQVPQGCSSFAQVVSCQRNPTHQPKPVCIGSYIQKKSSALHATFLRMNSTVVNNPGSTSSQTLTLNFSRTNCSRSFALTPEVAGVRPSLQ